MHTAHSTVAGSFPFIIIPYVWRGLGGGGRVGRGTGYCRAHMLGVLAVESPARCRYHRSSCAGPSLSYCSVLP